MATSDFWQRLSASVCSQPDWADDAEILSRSTQGKVRIWILIDFLTVLSASIIATICDLHISPVLGARAFYEGTLFYGRSMWMMLGLLCWFATALVIASRRVNLYSPIRLTSFFA